MRKLMHGISCLVLIASTSTLRAELEQEPFSIIVDDSYATTDAASNEQGQPSSREQPPSIVARSEPSNRPAQRPERAAPAPATDYSWWRWLPLTDY